MDRRWRCLLCLQKLIWTPTISSNHLSALWEQSSCLWEGSIGNNFFDMHAIFFPFIFLPFPRTNYLNAWIRVSELTRIWWCHMILISLLLSIFDERFLQEVVGFLVKSGFYGTSDSSLVFVYSPSNYFIRLVSFVLPKISHSKLNFWMVFPLLISLRSKNLLMGHIGNIIS